MRIKYYGNQSETVIVTKKGIFLIQSPDMTSDYEKLNAIPKGMKILNPAICADLIIPDEIQ